MAVILERKGENSVHTARQLQFAFPFVFSHDNSINKKLSWCWQTRATRLEVSQGHQTYYHSIS